MLIRTLFIYVFLILAFMQPGNAQSVGKDSMLQQVVVTGPFAPQSLRQSVYQVRTITQESIRLRGATDVLEALRSEPGIRFSTDATLGETDIQLMGLSGMEVKVLLDGIPLVDRGANRQSLSQIDINSIDHIEIVEGPMSVIYGSDALAGVINIITKRAVQRSGYCAPAQLRVGVSVREETMGKEYAAFSGKGLHQENLNLGWQRGQWDLGASLTRNSSGGWQGDTTGRAREWMPKDQLFAGGTLGFHNDRIRVSYRLDYLDETLKSLGNYFPPNYKTTDAHYITNRYTHLGQLEWKASEKWHINGSMSYQNYQRRTQTTDIDLQTGQRTLSLNQGSQDTSTFLTWFGRSTVQFSATEKLAFQGGLEFKNDRSTGQRIEGHPEITDYSFFVSAEYKPVPGLTVRPGIRMSKNSIYDAPPVVPALNAKLFLGKDLDLRVSYARGFRAPSLRELYFNFHDANHDINGNPDLKAEYSNSFNASLTKDAVTRGSWRSSATVTGFYNDYHNFIGLAVGAGNQYYYMNTDRYKTTGGTLSYKLYHKSLTAVLGFSYIGSYNKYSDDPAYKQPGMSAFTWSPELTANMSWTWKANGLQAGLFYKYTGRQPTWQLVTVNQAETVQLVKTGAFSKADLTLSKPFGRWITVNAGVKNLFNVTRISNSSQDAGSAHSTGGPVLKAYGRSYGLGLNFQWERQTSKNKISSNNQ